MAVMVGRLWDVFQPLLFGLIGAEITITNLSPSTVGKMHTPKNTEYNLDVGLGKNNEQFTCG